MPMLVSATDGRSSSLAGMSTRRPC
jgi:hypothetical protein